MDKYISILLIALCIVISPAASRYTMEITAVSYVNPTDEDFDGGDCDPFPFGGLCDVYFKFCVRNLNTPATTIDNCWPGHMVQSSNDIETQSYTFPPIGPLYPQAGVSNPITFTSSSAWPGSFQLLVVIYDDDNDFGNDDLVDRNVFNLVLPADGTTSSNMAVLGVYSKATFTARIRVSCEQGFSGNNCLTTTPSTTTTSTGTSTSTTTTTSTTGTSTTSTAIIAAPSTTTSTTGTSTTSTAIIAAPSITTSTGTSTSTTDATTTTRSSSSPTPTAGQSSPSVELFTGLGATGIFIVIVLLVIIAMVGVSICCYQKGRKSQPVYEDNRYPTFPMRNMNRSNETKAALAQGFGVPVCHGCEAHIYETAYNKDYTYNYVT